MRKLLSTTVASLITMALLPGLAPAVEIYHFGQSPFDLKKRANPYKAGNLYNNQNPFNPYSDFQDPYSPKSVRNDQAKYGAQTKTFNGRYQGVISAYTNTPQSLTNPYGKQGSGYNPQGIHNDYNYNSTNNSQSVYRAPYNPDSVFNSNKYSGKIYDRNGQYRGNIDTTNPHIRNNYDNPYNNYGNPFNKNSIFNIYNR